MHTQHDNSHGKFLTVYPTRALHQVTDLAASAERLHKEHVVMIKSQMEVEEENIVNRLQRQIEGLLANYKALEAGLEARGLSVKDLGTGPLTVDRSTEWVYGRSPTKSGDLARRSGEILSAHPPHANKHEYMPCL